MYTNSNSKNKQGDTFLNRFFLVLGSAIVIMFFSEMFFFNEGEHFYFLDHFSSLNATIDFFVIFILFYMLCSLWLLIPIYIFKVRSLWALFFSGALLGWAIEGIMPIMYFELPQAILWPAGSWHILINVFFGWYFLRKILEKNNIKLTALIFIGMGIFWGVWGTWFWSGNGVEDITSSNYPPEEISDTSLLPIKPLDFALLTFSMTGLLYIGYSIMDKLGGISFTPSKASIVITLLFSFFFLFALSGVFSLLFLGLTGATSLLLNQNRKKETRANILSTFNPGIKPLNLFLIFLMPLTANIIYPIMYNNNFSLGLTGTFGFILYPIIITGAIMFIISAVMILKKN